MARVTELNIYADRVSIKTSQKTKCIVKSVVHVIFCTYVKHMIIINLNTMQRQKQLKCSSESEHITYSLNKHYDIIVQQSNLITCI